MSTVRTGEKPVTRTEAPPAPSRLRLVLLSFLMLLVELMLIRWTAAYVVYVAYFTNFILLGSFLGIGVGFLRAKSDKDHFPTAPILLAAFVAFVALFPVQVKTLTPRALVGLFGMPALPMWFTLSVIFLGVVAIMAAIAEGVARTFAQFPPLTAYRLDIMGSLLGIATFSALAFLELRPFFWGLVVVALFWALLRPAVRRWHVAALAAFLALLGAGSLVARDYWSPYYRVSALPAGHWGTLRIKVNGIPHQTIVPVSEIRRAHAFYLFPYRHLGGKPLRNVLIVGAGTGNDLAVALSEGAAHVDAVEVDPVIHSIGVHEHPDHPYQDPRVTSHIEDGRAFLQQTNRKYDLVVFALPDSLTLVSGQAALRLESYLFTVEAFRTVRSHLAPGGAFTMYNFYRPDVFDRYAETILTAFGHPPCIDQGNPQAGKKQLAVLTVGLRAGDIKCSNPWVAPATKPMIATDDHPFPYLASRSIPPIYVVTLLLVLLASLAITRWFGGPFTRMRSYADLFFMGGAFLLLETKNIVQFALLFGTTWFVNALVFFGILLAVLAAVEVARAVKLPPARLLYLALAACLAVAWIVPPETLLSLPFVPRLAAAIAIAFSPVFLANLVFAQRFRDVGSSTVAFGANLLGAMVGGLLEYSALIIGYRDLLIVVFALYLLAFVTSPLVRRRVAAG